MVSQGTPLKFSMQEGQLRSDSNWLSVYCNVQHVTSGPEDETQHLTFQSVQQSTTKGHLSTLRIANRRKKIALPLFPKTLGVCALLRAYTVRGIFFPKGRQLLMSSNGGDSGY